MRRSATLPIYSKTPPVEEYEHLAKNKRHEKNQYPDPVILLPARVFPAGPGSLGDEVDLGFMKTNRLSALLVVLEHTGEHKGQLIAYARSNGVVPPWSRIE